MSIDVTEILDVALGLPERDRLAIVGRLMETLPAHQPEDDEAFAEELDRRSGDWENAIPWEQLRSELRQEEP